MLVYQRGTIFVGVVSTSSGFFWVEGGLAKDQVLVVIQVQRQAQLSASFELTVCFLSMISSLQFSQYCIVLEKDIRVTYYRV